ncbi:translation initiation factor Sui1 [Methylomagnum ishizawai]|uniref:translation initiation factor Sui1 n=1 Tax=Methylomagnum ishizawai TaxID=1760988 RepID=UPI001C3273E6|nr:translation initiation factor Sui1 [Methylomagnum ishizawai]BBL72917.1 translation initiation factor [Methylomagnum ishizawai]
MNSKKSPATGGLVYSTGQGRMCPACRQPVARCACKKSPVLPKTDGIVRVRLETKGRKGKGVTVVTGASADPAELDSLAKQLKQRCGSGGTVKEGVIEIQGDHVALVMEEFQKRGKTVKKAGG